ncbi:hypothetical protein GCM10023228_24240 [Brevibacillus fulvus]
MAKNFLYYLAWEEDDWLDEILDRFPEINALVPTSKTFQLLQEQQRSDEVKRAVIVLNAAHQQEKCREFLQRLQADPVLSTYPLYIVGLRETEEQEWQQAFPQAKIIVITGFAVEFNYEQVLDQMEADLGGDA